MIEDLRNMGPAYYHHHYHNPIVGEKEIDWRYNAKWNKSNRSNSIQTPLANDIGQIKVGEFQRGQGGIFDKVERPFDAKIAHDLFVQYEK